jgi:hypothetical protein
MTGIDIGLYDFDPHATVFFFIVSPDEEIYLRYGGRDAVAADSYLDLASLELALELGLEQHARWRAGELPERPRPAPFFPRDIEALQETEMSGRRSCVECHHIGDYQAAEMEAAGELDKPRIMFRSPDIRAIGIHLDVPQGLTVARASGAAAEAGLSSGDRIVALNETAVLTFGDFLYAYDALDRASTGLRLSVGRDGAHVDLQVSLPPLWWAYDIGFRRWSIDPMTFFDSEPLSTERKSELGLPAEGLACEVTSVSPRARAQELHTLDPGDVIYSVAGAQAGSRGESCELFIKLNVRSGSAVDLGVVRDGHQIEMRMSTHRQYYRMTPPARSRP